MAMTTKKELQKEIEALKKQLKNEQKRPTGHTISGVTIDMSRPDETKIAVAKAVYEGMKALQSLGGNSYGIYLPSNEEK